jgi:acetolactate synthase-1/2/3 large subunit
MHGARSTNFILQESDLLVVLGARFDDRAIGKTEQFCPNAKIIHVDIDKAELGKIKQPHVAIQGDVGEVLAQLLPQIDAQPREEWRGLVAQLQQEFPSAIPQGGDPLTHYGLINAVAACVDDEATWRHQSGDRYRRCAPRFHPAGVYHRTSACLHDRHRCVPGSRHLRHLYPHH